MSVGFRAVQWNRDKLVYDALLLTAVALYIAGFLVVVARLEPPKDALGEIDLRIRAFGSATFLMLTAILAIGPLARLDRRFLPLLYNRRHFGVLTFCIAVTDRLMLFAEILVAERSRSLRSFTSSSKISSHFSTSTRRRWATSSHASCRNARSGSSR